MQFNEFEEPRSAKICRVCTRAGEGTKWCDLDTSAIMVAIDEKSRARKEEEGFGDAYTC